jgi:hypothetical protein
MPSPIIAVFFCVLAFALAASSDWLEIMHLRAVAANAPRLAATMSILMWGVGSVGLLLCIEVSWWLLPFEALGLWVGTHAAFRRKTEAPAAGVGHAPTRLR